MGWSIVDYYYYHLLLPDYVPRPLGSRRVARTLASKLSTFGPACWSLLYYPLGTCSWARGRLRHDASISLQKETVAQMKSAVCEIQVCWLLADDVGVSMEVNK